MVFLLAVQVSGNHLLWWVETQKCVAGLFGLGCAFLSIFPFSKEEGGFKYIYIHM